MEQAFNDLLRERAKDKRGLFGFALWMFAETFAGIIGENMTANSRQKRGIIRIALTTASLLLLPYIAMRFTDQVSWDLIDFVIAGVLLFGAGLTYELIARKSGNIAYRAAVGVAVATALLLVWVSLAVGIIGNEGNPANLMYIGVLAVGIIGALIARLQPLQMSRVLFATAFAQMLVAVIAQIAGLGFTFISNGLFAMLWIGSALLFRNTSAADPT